MLYKSTYDMIYIAPLFQTSIFTHLTLFSCQAGTAAGAGPQHTLPNAPERG